MTDLSTYEGRRAAWADEIDSGRYEQYTGGALRRQELTDHGGEKPWCCCLGVACELIVSQAPEVLALTAFSSKYAYHRPDENPNVSGPQVSFLPKEAAEWLGVISSNPTAVLDETFIKEFKAEQVRRMQHDFEPIVLTSVITDRATHRLSQDDVYELAVLNDAKVPFPLIAGLIRRECLTDAKTGLVEAAA